MCKTCQEWGPDGILKMALVDRTTTSGLNATVGPSKELPRSTSDPEEGWFSRALWATNQMKEQLMENNQDQGVQKIQPQMVRARSRVQRQPQRMQDLTLPDVHIKRQRYDCKITSY